MPMFYQSELLGMTASNEVFHPRKQLIMSFDQL